MIEWEFLWSCQVLWMMRANSLWSWGWLWVMRTPWAKSQGSWQSGVYWVETDPGVKCWQCCRLGLYGRH